MTEQERQERISNGYLWEDTDEYLAHQAKVKDLMYEFNRSMNTTRNTIGKPSV